MAEKSLLTLREIAEELGVNHKTIHHYKHVFEEFVSIQYQGRKIKFLPINIDLFSKILELKDEGYSNEAISEKLKAWRSNDLTIYLSNYLSNHPTGCLSNYPSNYPSNHLSDHLSNCPSDYLSDDPSDCRSDGPSAHTSEEQTDVQNEQVEEDAQEQAQGVGVEAPDIEERLSEIKADLQSQLPAMVEQQVKTSLGQQVADLTRRMEDALLQMTAQMNGSLTELYKQIEQLQEGIRVLDSRLTQLETDLGADTSGQIELAECDLDQLQVTAPAISMEDAGTEQGDSDLADEGGGSKTESNTDLEDVKNSIHHGKPNREAVIQWILEEKIRDPGISYGELANRLNQAGILTLRGREGWTRGVVRNLAIRTNGNDA